jgi:hypothetical protein
MKLVPLTLVEGATRKITITKEDNTTVITTPSSIEFDFVVNNLVTNFGGSRLYQIVAEDASETKAIEFTVTKSVLGSISQAIQPFIANDLHEELSINSTVLTYINNLL